MKRLLRKTFAAIGPVQRSLSMRCMHFSQVIACIVYNRQVPRSIQEQTFDPHPLLMYVNDFLGFGVK